MPSPRNKKGVYLASDKLSLSEHSQNPEISFFRPLFKKYTNFYRNIQQIDSRQNVNIGTDPSYTINVPKQHGHLLSKLMFRIVLPEVKIRELKHEGRPSHASIKFWWTNKIGLALFKSISLSIDDVVVDKQSKHWMNIWNELTQDKDQKHEFNSFIGSYETKNITDKIF